MTIDNLPFVHRNFSIKQPSHDLQCKHSQKMAFDSRIGLNELERNMRSIMLGSQVLQKSILKRFWRLSCDKNDCIRNFIAFNRLRSIADHFSFILRVVRTMLRCKPRIAQTKCFRAHVRPESNDLYAPMSSICSESDAHGHHSELRPRTHTHSLSDEARCAVRFACLYAYVWLLVTLNNSMPAAATLPYRQTVLYVSISNKIHVQRSLRNPQS